MKILQKGYYKSMCHLCESNMGNCKAKNQKECYLQFKRAVEKEIKKGCGKNGKNAN